MMSSLSILFTFLVPLAFGSEVRFAALALNVSIDVSQSFTKQSQVDERKKSQEPSKGTLIGICLELCNSVVEWDSGVSQGL